MVAEQPVSTTPQHSLLEGLNAEQLSAVTTPGNQLVLAGAGSGKTKVLSTKIAYLMHKGDATQESILAVTFTNKAAREMRNRISKLVGGPVPHLWVGTFHGICNQMLREFGKKIGVDPNFHIMDETDQTAMVKRITKDLDYTADDLKVRGESLSSLVRQINKIKEDGGQFQNDNSVLAEVYTRYIDVCQREGALDFADLMLKVNSALKNNTAGIRDHYRSRFSHILVDEYQDTNKEQALWLTMIKRDNAEIFAVGDDDQSIYSFRGANPEAMTGFMKDIAAGKVTRLEVNYRSTGNILAAANEVISNNSGRIGKKLRTGGLSGEKVKVFEFERDRMESDFIAKEIKRLIEAGAKHTEIAVLYRSNHQSGSLERAMLNHGVPYIIHGGTRFFERQEIKDVVAYMRLAFKHHDNTAFNRIVNMPPRGIGDRAIAPVMEMIKDTDLPALEVARDAAKTPGSKFRGFIDLMDEVDIALDMMPLPMFVQYVIERSGLYEHYKGDDNAEARLKNIEELASLASRHADEHDCHEMTARESLGDFLATFALEDTGEENTQSRKKAITMMTIHAAKGLEFDHVFINGAEENQLPHKNSIEAGDSGIEEERRLMYVAITRARKNLYVCGSRERYVFGQAEPRTASRFVNELPKFACDIKQFGSPENRPQTNYAESRNSFGRPRRP